MPIMYVLSVGKLITEEKLNVMLTLGLEILITQKNWFAEDVRMSAEHKCVPNMELITWNINAVIVVPWPFSSVLEPLIFAMLVTTISSGWPMFLNKIYRNALLDPNPSNWKLTNARYTSIIHLLGKSLLLAVEFVEMLIHFNPLHRYSETHFIVGIEQIFRLSCR